MTVSPASQRRINRAVNQWIKAREAEKERAAWLTYLSPLEQKLAGQNRLTGGWTKRNDKSGKFVEVRTKAKPFKGTRRER